jgi:GH15 family glucan-1,4-alpha-glucosidase
MAAANFTEAFGESALARDYRDGAAQVREAALRHLCSTELPGFMRGLVPSDNDGDLHPDPTPDSSLCGIFCYGMLPAADPRVVQTVDRLRKTLWNPSPVGGMARYQDDPYFRSNPASTGNPWFVSTLWHAQHLAAVARTAADVACAVDLLQWTASHALPSGILSEQIDPASGCPLSVSPLTWSHAAFVTTVHHCLDALARIKGTQ